MDGDVAAAAAAPAAPLRGAALHVVTFLAWTGGVAVCTWFIVRRYVKSVGNASDDYFAGGRALKWYICAGSLMLTNLSTEQLVGLNGAVFADGCLAGIWWEAGAALAMIFTAWVFLPRYMALGLTTTSGFLGERYSLTLRTMVSVIFLVYYALVLCPLVLYTGALAIRDIFELPLPLWMVSLAIGLLGAAYALFGGLKAVAVSDSLNGIGLLIAGLWVPLAALQHLPGGLPGLFEDAAVDLRPLAASSARLEELPDGSLVRRIGTPSVPWHVVFTGMLLNNLYYWSTNQVIVQRVLASESLSNGQKGVLFAASMKVVGFTFLCLPGIIGIAMVQKGIVIDGKPFVVSKADAVYPDLVKAVMPEWSLGFNAAVLIGSCLSTFNSALNSAATMFGLEIYKIYVRPEAADKDVVRVAGFFGAGLALCSYAIAPQLEHVSSIYNLLQQVNSIVSLPIVTVFFVGIAASMPDAFAAKAGFAVAAVAVCLGQLIPNLQFLHLFFLCFLLASGTMALCTYWPALRRMLKQEPVPKAYESVSKAVVDMTPWRCRCHVGGAIVVLLLLLVVSLQASSFPLFVAFWCAWALALLGLLLFPVAEPAPAPAAARAPASPEVPSVVGKALDGFDSKVGGAGGSMESLESGSTAFSSEPPAAAA